MCPLVPVISQFSHLLQIHMLPVKFPWWLGVKGDQWPGRGRNVCYPPAFAVSSTVRGSHSLCKGCEQHHRAPASDRWGPLPGNLNSFLCLSSEFLGVPTPDRWYPPPKFTISNKPSVFAMESLSPYIRRYLVYYPLSSISVFFPVFQKYGYNYL